jgi:hypothetical protein
MKGPSTYRSYFQIPRKKNLARYFFAENLGMLYKLGCPTSLLELSGLILRAISNVLAYSLLLQPPLDFKPQI